MRTAFILGGTGGALLAAAVAVWGLWPAEPTVPPATVAAAVPRLAEPEPSPTASAPTGDGPRERIASLPPVLNAIGEDEDPALAAPLVADAPAPAAMAGAAVDVDPAAPTPTAGDDLTDAAPADPPAFDALRLGRLGDVVIAGRSAPGAEVMVLADGAEIGREIADGRGDWVFAGTVHLTPGAHELTLSAQTEGERPVVSEEVVVLVVPDHDGVPSGTEDRALALLTERDSLAASEILQAPDRYASLAPDAAPTPAVSLATRPTEAGSDATAPAADTGRAAGLIAGPSAAGVADDTAPLVAVDVIDYDDRGRVIVSGQAASPFARVRLYLDGLPVGTAVADAAGAFRAFLDDRVAPGRYRLRIDSLEDGETVAARAELPFERADIVLQADSRRVVIQPGNNLWTIARYVYGSGFRYTAIYQANQDAIRNPDLIFPGQVFSLPEERRGG